MRAVKILAGLDYVAYGGGAVPFKLGNSLMENGLNLIELVLYGATELGAILCYIREEGDQHLWGYTSFSGRVRIRWDPPGDGAYGCQILTWEKHQVAIENLSYVKGYATADIWVPHPTKFYLWKMYILFIKIHFREISLSP